MNNWGFNTRLKKLNKLFDLFVLIINKPKYV